MNSKKIIYSLGIILLVVLAIIVSEQLSNREPPEQQLRFFPGITESSIFAVKISEHDSRLKLSREGNEWYVQSVSETQKTPPDAFSEETGTTDSPKYLTDSASVEVALEKIVNLRKSMLVSENPDRQAAFEVDSESGIFIDVFDNSGSSLGAVRIGKNAAGFNSHYVRQIGSNSVYSVPGGVRFSFFTDIDRWRNRTVISFGRDLAYRISVNGENGSEYTLQKSSDGWRVVAPIEHYANQDAVVEIISTLSNLVAVDFENEMTSYDSLRLAQPKLTVSIDLTDGTQRKIIVGGKNEHEQHWTLAENRNDIFLISDSDFEQISRELDHLKGEEPQIAELTQESEE